MRLRLGALLLACTALASVNAEVTADINADANVPEVTEEPKSGLWKALSTILVGPPPIDAAARAAEDDADGILRLTDDNHEEIFANGKDDDVWVILATGPVHDPVTGPYKTAHLNASLLMRGYNESLPDPSTGPVSITHGGRVFHFTRLDWVSDFVISTRWVLTKPPYYIFVSDKGKTIRSLWAPKAPGQGEWLYFLITKGYWEKLPVWDGILSPTGSLSWLVELYIDLTRRWNAATEGIPRWGWMIVSMMFAGTVQRVISYLHGKFGSRQGTAEVNAVRKQVPTLPIKLKKTE